MFCLIVACLAWSGTYNIKDTSPQEQAFRITALLQMSLRLPFPPSPSPLLFPLHVSLNDTSLTLLFACTPLPLLPHDTHVHYRISRRLNWKDKQGWTALHLAARAGHSEICALLIANDEDVTLASDSGATAMHEAAGRGNADIISALQAAGADVDAACETGTPLHWAAGDGSSDAVAKLVDLGASVDATNSQGLTPLLLAAASQSRKCASLLIRGGADCGFVLSGGLTVMHILAETGQVRSLLLLGVRPHAS